MEPYVGEIRLFSFSKTPTGWLPCDGRTLNIQANQALYSLLGTNYGGDGKTTFQLPDLRGRTPVSQGQSPANAAAYQLGKIYGAESVAINISQTPSHQHAVMVNSAAGTTSNPTSNFYAGTAGTATIKAQQLYAPLTQTTGINLPPGTLGTTGGGQPHENRQPYAVIQFCIATAGVWPPRN